jgi:hypothetical protein
LFECMSPVSSSGDTGCNSTKNSVSHHLSLHRRFHFQPFRAFVRRDEMFGTATRNHFKSRFGQSPRVVSKKAFSNLIAVVTAARRLSRGLEITPFKQASDGQVLGNRLSRANVGPPLSLSGLQMLKARQRKLRPALRHGPVRKGFLNFRSLIKFLEPLRRGIRQS